MELEYIERRLDMPVVLPPTERNYHSNDEIQTERNYHSKKDAGLEHTEVRGASLEEDGINWNKRMTEGWILSNMLRLMLDFHIITLDRCEYSELIEFKTSFINPFKEYMEKYKRIKETAPKDSVERATSKDMSNNVTGKVVQKLRDMECKYIRDDTALDNLVLDVAIDDETYPTRLLATEEPTENLVRMGVKQAPILRNSEIYRHRFGYFRTYRPDRAPLHLGVFIYSGARELMYRNGYSKVPKFIYTDTDSLIFRASRMAHIGGLIDDKIYGRWKIECRPVRMILCDKKECYLEYIDDKGVKQVIFKFKGLEKGYVEKYEMKYADGTTTVIYFSEFTSLTECYKNFCLNKLDPNVVMMRIETRQYRNIGGLRFYQNYKYFKRSVCIKQEEKEVDKDMNVPTNTDEVN